MSDLRLIESKVYTSEFLGNLAQSYDHWLVKILEKCHQKLQMSALR